MYIPLTWFAFKLLGVPLVLISIMTLFLGSFPDHDGKSLANTLRWIFWPFLIFWIIVIFLRGLIV
ncbi:hypothetical protein C0583_04485 [Candidatus Parcubacteria bacterium]|nr:MAG: hypothetical protein C0583_04485 [Candidatus Parcubacteria bacterium]